VICSNVIKRNVVFFLQFKERGYTDPSFERRLATTTGQMLNQVVDPKLASSTLLNSLSATSPSVANRRRPVSRKKRVL
jgi:hypothetical protein